MTDDPPESDPPISRESAPLLLQVTRRLPLAPAPPTRRTRRQKAFTVRGAMPLVARTPLGAFGMIAAAMLFMIAIFADLVASDLPIMCSIHGSTYALPCVTHPAVLDDMDRDALDREASFVIHPLVAFGPTRGGPLLLPPLAKGHPFGTDRYGHDVFARVVHATRSYLVFATIAVFASVLLGVFLGGIGGLFGGSTDMLVGRLVETISAFPPLVLVIGIQAALPHASLQTLFLAIALTRFPEVARLVRAEVLTIATRDYIGAARALGASPFRILRRHIEPNVRGPIIVMTAVGISAVVLTEASLDFLHVGVPATSSSWGEIMSQFRDAPHAWWLLVFPGALLVTTVVGHNLIGESFREALDPRRHHR